LNADSHESLIEEGVTVTFESTPPNPGKDKPVAKNIIITGKLEFGKQTATNSNSSRACNCYLKVVDGRELGQGLPMVIEDVVTLYLDILAQRVGFSQG